MTKSAVQVSVEGSLVALLISNYRPRLDDNKCFRSDVGSEMDENMSARERLDEGIDLDESTESDAEVEFDKETT